MLISRLGPTTSHHTMYHQRTAFKHCPSDNSTRPNRCVDLPTNLLKGTMLHHHLTDKMIEVAVQAMNAPSQPIAIDTTTPTVDAVGTTDHVATTNQIITMALGEMPLPSTVVRGADQLIANLQPPALFCKHLQPPPCLHPPVTQPRPMTNHQWTLSCQPTSNSLSPLRHSAETAFSSRVLPCLLRSTKAASAQQCFPPQGTSPL